MKFSARSCDKPSLKNTTRHDWKKTANIQHTKVTILINDAVGMLIVSKYQYICLDYRNIRISVSFCFAMNLTIFGEEIKS